MNPATAQTWRATRFGGPDVLELVEAVVLAPKAGEVIVDVRAVGMNPADYKHIAAGQDPRLLPLSVGFEVSGVISALGPDTEIASGGGQIGDGVIAAQITGGYATRVCVAARDVFAKPERLSFAAAAGLILAGSTASELLHATGVGAGDTILVHAAAGAVGISAVQQARALGARVIGTASEASFNFVRHHGGEPVRNGEGLEARVAALAKAGLAAAIDTIGTDDAIDVSLALVTDRKRIATTVAFSRAAAEGFQSVGAHNPRSGPYRAWIRPHLMELVRSGQLDVPVGRVFRFVEAPAALSLLMGRHPDGKLALIVDP